MRHCHIGYIVQAICCNLLPLFFAIFRSEYGISNTDLSFLILLNFVTQICVDFLAGKSGDKLGYRRAMILAHLCSAFGLALTGITSMIFTENIYPWLCAGTFLFAAGSGLLEVMVSPLVDAAVEDSKTSAMSLLHSFYSWGQAAVVIITTVIIKLLGSELWYTIPLLWALLPLINVIPFFKIPLPEMLSEDERTPVKELFKDKRFIVFIIMMMSAGASELSMAQWSSYFAEMGLGVSKLMGDLLGPCAFAIFMGIARLIFGIYGEKLPLNKCIFLCSLLCVVCYITAGAVLNPIIALCGCALTGFSVGIMWPGTISLVGGVFSGGTAMFGLLALAGDLGCSIGPFFAGIVSDFVENNNALFSWVMNSGLTKQQLGIKIGILAATVFPIITVVCTAFNFFLKKRTK